MLGFSVAGSNFTSAGGSARSAASLRVTGAVQFDAFADFHFGVGNFLQNGVLLQFLLDERFNSRVGACSRASDCCNCGASTCESDILCDKCNP